MSSFLEARSDALVSMQHATWLAFLIWLHDAGYALRLKNMKAGGQFVLEPFMKPITPEHLARWIGQLAD